MPALAPSALADDCPDAWTTTKVKSKIFGDSGLGVFKINVDTDNRLAMTGAVRKALMEKPAEFDLRYYLKPARAAMLEVVRARMTSFGQAGNAGKVPLQTLDEMKKVYDLATA